MFIYFYEGTRKTFAEKRNSTIREIHNPWREKHSISAFFFDDETTAEYPNFIIGLDPDGEPIAASCNPSQLSGYPGSGPNHPNRFERVCFQSEVLQRYSTNPDKYQISDRSIACVINGRTLWQLDISTNSDGLVEAYLGDLGSRLPHKELPYWKSFNIAPSGTPNPNRVLRDHFNIPTDASDAPVLELMSAFRKASENVKEQLGVSIWKEPDSHTLKKDQHACSANSGQH